MPQPLPKPTTHTSTSRCFAPKPLIAVIGGTGPATASFSPASPAGGIRADLPPPTARHPASTSSPAAQPPRDQTMGQVISRAHDLNYPSDDQYRGDQGSRKPDPDSHSPAKAARCSSSGQESRVCPARRESAPMCVLRDNHLKLWPSLNQGWRIQALFETAIGPVTESSSCQHSMPSNCGRRSRVKTGSRPVLRCAL